MLAMLIQRANKHISLQKNDTGHTRVCCMCTDKKAATREKENIERGKSLTGTAQPSLLTLKECLILISINRDEAFELDTFIILMEEMKGDGFNGLSVHEFANGLCDQLAGASDFHWK
jgi:hypothetical protein